MQIKTFVVDEDQLVALRKIAERLQAGTDRERDEGHKLWLLVNDIANQSLPS